jgi:hypothetical protein
VGYFFIYLSALARTCKPRTESCGEAVKGGGVKNGCGNIIEDHKLWLEGKGGARAKLFHAKLSGAKLYKTDLVEADLSMTNLNGATLGAARGK